MKDNHKADVSHTDEFNRIYQEMVKHAEDKYKVKSEHPKTEEEARLVDNLSSRWVNEFNLPDGYIFKDENGNVINAQKIVLEKKKKEYPKTYEECAKLLNTYCGSNGGYNWKLLSYFQPLLICRDAYWKLYGEEVGLGKPWKPDWEGEGWYVIVNHRGDIVTNIQWHANAILAFPTARMRDAFYENFKEEIENCKELL